MEDPVALKAELVSEIRDSQPSASWPVEPPNRSLAQLRQQAELLRQQQNEKQKLQAAATAKREAKKAEE